MFTVIPLESRPQPAPVSPYLVTAKLVHPYVLSYHTGLELHGVAQSSFYRVFVATPRRFEPFEYQGVAYQRVHAREREVRAASTQVTVEAQPVAVATREWTVAHCALRLDLAGGIEELLKSVANFAHLDPAKLHAAAVTLGHKVFINRLGFLLALHRETWSVSDEDLRPFRDRMSSATSYFGAKRGSSRYVKEWHLMVPENLEQVMRPCPPTSRRQR